MGRGWLGAVWLWAKEVRRVVTQPGWEEFPSSPMLYQVVTETG